MTVARSLAQSSLISSIVTRHMKCGHLSFPFHFIINLVGADVKAVRRLLAGMRVHRAQLGIAHTILDEVVS